MAAARALAAQRTAELNNAQANEQRSKELTSVQSLSGGSGQAFSLLPAQNATGHDAH